MVVVGYIVSQHRTVGYYDKKGKVNIMPKCAICSKSVKSGLVVDSECFKNMVVVVRCKECIYYHKAHILCNDGTEKDILEFPKEALDFTGACVTSKYGINVGGRCELEKNCGYAEDKSVFRQPNDYCGHGERSVENV